MRIGLALVRGSRVTTRRRVAVSGGASFYSGDGDFRVAPRKRNQINLGGSSVGDFDRDKLLFEKKNEFLDY